METLGIHFAEQPVEYLGKADERVQFRRLHRVDWDFAHPELISASDINQDCFPSRVRVLIACHGDASLPVQLGLRLVRDTLRRAFADALPVPASVVFISRPAPRSGRTCRDGSPQTRRPHAQHSRRALAYCCA